MVMAQTASPSSTLIPTPSPTIIVNPSGNIFITEISPTSDTEWTEIYNNNDNQVQLTKWKLKTETTTRNIPDNTIINPKSFYIFNTTNFYSDTVPKTANIIDQNNNQIDSAGSYPAGLDNGLSWSKQIDNHWCQTFPSSNQVNSDCYSPPTLTPTDTPPPPNTPTPTLAPTSTNIPTPTITLTPTIIFIPSPSCTDIPEIITTFTPTPTGSVLSVSINSESSPESKKTDSLAKNIPVIFMTAGGILLAVPLVITEFKKF